MSAGVVIAGGGLAAQRAAETLRRSGYDGRVQMICAEPVLPYDRPPLSKDVLADPAAEAKLAFRTADWYDAQAIELLLGVPATGLDLPAGHVTAGDGRRIAFDQLLIATGSRPRTLPLLRGRANVSVLRDRTDAQTLRRALRPGARIAIVGAGFIGQEVAAAAVKAGARVTMIEAAATPLHLLLGEHIGSWFARWHRRNDVELLLGRVVTGLEGDGRVDALRLDDATEVACDHVVVGIGVVPETSWLAGSGLEIGAGGRTSAPRVFVAGDAAGGAHWESAARQGAAAARAMLGLPPAKSSPESFWSDLYGTRVQYLGHAAHADDHVIDGDPERADFSVTYTRARQPVAVLLVGRPHALPAARALLAT